MACCFQSPVSQSAYLAVSCSCTFNHMGPSIDSLLELLPMVKLAFRACPRCPRGTTVEYLTWSAAIGLEAHRGLTQTYHTGENPLVTKALLATLPKYSSTQIIFQAKGLMCLWLQTCVVLSLFGSRAVIICSFNSLI